MNLTFSNILNFVSDFNYLQKFSNILKNSQLFSIIIKFPKQVFNSTFSHNSTPHSQISSKIFKNPQIWIVQSPQLLTSHCQTSSASNRKWPQSFTSMLPSWIATWHIKRQRGSQISNHIEGPPMFSTLADCLQRLQTMDILHYILHHSCQLERFLRRFTSLPVKTMAIGGLWRSVQTLQKLLNLRYSYQHNQHNIQCQSKHLLSDSTIVNQRQSWKQIAR